MDLKSNKNLSSTQVEPSFTQAGHRPVFINSIPVLFLMQPCLNAVTQVLVGMAKISDKNPPPYPQGLLYSQWHFSYSDFVTDICLLNWGDAAAEKYCLEPFLSLLSH